MKKEFQKYNRKSIFSDLKDFDLGFAKENDYIEITEWHNGEGFDVDIHTSQPQSFQLTWGQYSAMKKMIKELGK